MIARIWRAAFAVGNLRLWSIILGPPYGEYRFIDGVAFTHIP